MGGPLGLEGGASKRETHVLTSPPGKKIKKSAKKKKVDTSETTFLECPKNHSSEVSGHFGSIFHFSITCCHDFSENVLPAQAGSIILKIDTKPF